MNRKNKKMNKSEPRKYFIFPRALKHFMKKNLFPAVFLSVFFFCMPLQGCKNDKPAGINPQKQNAGRHLKHIFMDDNGITGFFTDGSVALGPWYDLNDVTLEALYGEEPYAFYKELPDSLLIEDKEILFSDDNGALAREWIMIDFKWTGSANTITNYAAFTEDFDSEDMQEIDDTCFIEIMPETKIIDDEESEEALSYFTSMDDYAYYLSESRARFKSMNIKSITAQNRYLLFSLKGGSRIIVDTEAEQSGKHIKALLYKKGKKPLIVDITDSNTQQYKYYLQN